MIDAINLAHPSTLPSATEALYGVAAAQAAAPLPDAPARVSRHVPTNLDRPDGKRLAREPALPRQRAQRDMSSPRAAGIAGHSDPSRGRPCYHQPLGESGPAPREERYTFARADAAACTSCGRYSFTIEDERCSMCRGLAPSRAKWGSE